MFNAIFGPGKEYTYILGNYDDSWEFAHGDKALCTECLCKGMHKFKKFCTSLEKISRVGGVRGVILYYREPSIVWIWNGNSKNM